MATMEEKQAVIARLHVLMQKTITLNVPLEGKQTHEQRFNAALAILQAMADEGYWIVYHGPAYFEG